jgi:hypothetical protein
VDGCHEMTGLIVKPVWFITWIICKDDHYQGKVNQTICYYVTCTCTNVCR